MQRKMWPGDPVAAQRKKSGACAPDDVDWIAKKCHVEVDCMDSARLFLNLGNVEVACMDPTRNTTISSPWKFIRVLTSRSDFSLRVRRNRE
ncbi:hypothetical protein SUGI_0716720 [Cryptomeria japonica]|nr:hypothetical protein SUGI_0716720 [Cryptomeria japonica]